MPMPNGFLGSRDSVLGSSLLGWLIGIEELTAKIPNLALYYRLEEPSGSVAVDYFASRSGTYTGSPTFLQAGPSTNGVLLNSGASIRSGGTALNVSTGTISLWFKISSNPASNALLFGMFENSTTFDKTLHITSAGLLVFTAIETSGGATRTGTTAAVPLGRWNHICVTFGNFINMYLNGAQVVTNATCAATKSNYTTAGNMYIGGGNPGSSFIALPGYYDELAISNGTRISAQQALELYTAGTYYAPSSSARLTQEYVEVAKVMAAPTARTTVLNVESIRDAAGAKARISQIYVETIRSSADGTIYTPATVSQTLSFTETTTPQKIGIRSSSDTLSFTETTTPQKIGIRSSSDTLSFTETVDGLYVSSPGVIYTATIGQTLSLTETIDKSKVSEDSLSHTLSFTDSEVDYVVHTASHDLTFTDSVDFEHILGRDMLQGLDFLETVGLEIIVAREFNDDPLILFQTVSAYIVHNQESLQGLNFTQTATGFSTKWADDSLNLSETIDRVMTYNRTVSQTLSLTQVANILQEGYSYSQTLNFTQSVSYENTIHPTYEENVTQTLSFTTAVDYTRTYNQSIVQSLAFTETAERGAVEYARSVDQILSFAEVDFPQSLSLGSGNQQVTQSQPVAQVTIVHDYVVLSSRGMVIVLPAPQFGDGESNENTMTLKKTMSGRIFTYVKTNDRVKLTWTFDLARRKMDELTNFIRSNIGELLEIRDWKGRIFVAYITSNPNPTTTQGRYDSLIENLTISIEFQGVKIHG